MSVKYHHVVITKSQVSSEYYHERNDRSLNDLGANFGCCVLSETYKERRLRFTNVIMTAEFKKMAEAISKKRSVIKKFGSVAELEEHHEGRRDKLKKLRLLL